MPSRASCLTAPTRPHHCPPRRVWARYARDWVRWVRTASLCQAARCASGRARRAARARNDERAAMRAPTSAPDRLRCAAPLPVQPSVLRCPTAGDSWTRLPAARRSYDRPMVARAMGALPLARISCSDARPAVRAFLPHLWQLAPRSLPPPPPAPLANPSPHAPKRPCCSKASESPHSYRAYRCGWLLPPPSPHRYAWAQVAHVYSDGVAKSAVATVQVATLSSCIQVGQVAAPCGTAAGHSSESRGRSHRGQWRRGQRGYTRPRAQPLAHIRCCQ